MTITATASRWTPPATPTLRDTRIRATFPPPLGPSRRPTVVIRDAFVTELNPTGSGLVYSTYLGGSGDDVRLRHRGGHLRQRLRYGNHVFERLSHDPWGLPDDLRWCQRCLRD